MITFLPFASFTASAQCLDNARLNKQFLEARQILAVIEKTSNKRGWANHPAVKMWEGYHLNLREYLNALSHEIYFRFGKHREIFALSAHKDDQEEDKHNNDDGESDDEDSTRRKENKVPFSKYAPEDKGEPWWLGFSLFHFSHQAALVRKLPEHYTEQFPTLPAEQAKYGYFWPSKFPEKVRNKKITKKDYSKYLATAATVIRCTARYKSGGNKGKQCAAKAKPGKKLCGRHNK